MLPGSSYSGSLALDESVPSAKRKKSVSEIINDLSLIVQNLVAGTGTVSTNVLSDGCMQLKIHLPEKSPKVLLQFPLESNLSSKLVQHVGSDEEEENGEKDRSVYGNKMYPKGSVSEGVPENSLSIVPLTSSEQRELNDEQENRFGNKTYSRCTSVSENIAKNSSSTAAIVTPSPNYNKMNETKNDEKTIKGFGSKTYSRCKNVHDSKANLSTVTPIIKSEKPELLAVLNDSDENDDADSSQTDTSTPLKTSCQLKPKDKARGPLETEYIEVTPDLDMSFLHTKSAEWKSESATFEKMFKTNANNKGLKTYEQRMSGVEKPFSCIYCDKSFKTKHEQKQHEWIHTGEKLLSSQCGDTNVAAPNTLNPHKRNHAGESPYSSDGNKKSLQTHKKIYANKKLYSCSNCLASLNKTKKANKGFHLCLDCGKTFTNARLLEEHKIIHSI